MPTLSESMKALFTAGHTEAEIMDALRRQAAAERISDAIDPLALDTQTPVVQVVVNDWVKLDQFFDSPQRTNRRTRELAIQAMREARRTRNAKQLTKMALLALKSLSLNE